MSWRERAEQRGNDDGIEAGRAKTQILQTLAGMLEQPQGKITTAALAAKVGVSEAAFIVTFRQQGADVRGADRVCRRVVFTLVNQIARANVTDGRRPSQTIDMLLGFAEKNPGMVRVLIGDAWSARWPPAKADQSADRSYRSVTQAVAATGAAAQSLPAGEAANALVGLSSDAGTCMQKSGFRRKPTSDWTQQAAFCASARRCPPGRASALQTACGQAATTRS